MTVPFFSIVIPTLNEETTLPHLLVDISHQTYRSFEVCIIDCGSKDETIEIVTEVMRKDKRFTLDQSKKKNVSIQRNLGAKNAHGTWILFLDADSRIENDFLSKLKDQLRKQKCDGFTCYAVPDTTALDAIAYVQLQNILLETMATLGTPYSVGACMGCKRSVVEKIGGFNPKIHHMEDSEFAKRMHERGYVFRVLRKPNYVYSLRRQRKEGKLAMMSKLFPYYLKSMVSNEFSTPAKLYPMKGGSK